MTAIAILASGERVPLTDSWDEARRLWRDEQYDAEVIGIDQDSETPGSASPEPEPQTPIRRKRKHREL